MSSVLVVLIWLQLICVRIRLSEQSWLVLGRVGCDLGQPARLCRTTEGLTRYAHDALATLIGGRLDGGVRADSRQGRWLELATIGHGPVVAKLRLHSFRSDYWQACVALW